LLLLLENFVKLFMGFGVACGVNCEGYLRINSINLINLTNCGKNGFVVCY